MRLADARDCLSLLRDATNVQAIMYVALPSLAVTPVRLTSSDGLAGIQHSPHFDTELIALERYCLQLAHPSVKDMSALDHTHWRSYRGPSAGQEEEEEERDERPEERG